MKFEQLQSRYRELVAQRQAGQINAGTFDTEVASLRTQDATQRWWQIDPASGQWLTWDGSQWRAASPPQDNVAEPAPPPFPGTSTPLSATTIAVPGSLQGFLSFLFDLWRRFLSRMITPGDFLRQGRLPLAQRSQGWWDVLGVAGGALSGYIWFLYSSIRGMPHFKLIGMNGGRDVWYDFIPSIVLAALPFLAFFFRRKLLAALDPVWSKIKANPAYGLTMAGWIAGGALLLNFLGPNLFGWAFNFREGLDFTTPLLMLAIPLALALFRSETDKLLMPMQAFRKSIPKFLLVGIALAIPYALAFVIYRVAFNQYELLHLNVIFGILLPYALLRNPVPGLATPRSPGALPIVFLLLPLLLLLMGSFIPEAYADDCARDIFNLRDCLRTSGFAETMSGTAASVVSVLVNGAEITRIVIVPPPAPPAPAGTSTKEGEESPPRVFRVQVTYQDSMGRQRNVFYADMQDRITISAWVEEDTPDGTVGVSSTIQMSLTAGQSWARLDSADSGSVATVMQLVRRDAQPFSPESHVDAPQVLVSATVPTASAPITTRLSFGIRRFGIHTSGPTS